MLKALALTVLLAAAPARAGGPAPPSEIYGRLFADVQLARVFPDGKTFADAVPLRPPAAIIADYARAAPRRP